MAGGREVATALGPGGRFAFTVEEGAPLDATEREQMPDADTVWLVPLSELLGDLEQAGLRVTWQQDSSAAHREQADALFRAFTDEASEIAQQIGRREIDDLLAAHRLWSDWLRDGRVRKFAIVAEKPGPAASSSPFVPLRPGQRPWR